MKAREKRLTGKGESRRGPRLVVGVDVVATAAGELTDSEDVLAAVPVVVAAAEGLLTGSSEDLLG
jgi:hypothetical protein